MVESPALELGKQTAKTWFGLEKEKKISLIINADLYLPFFLLIIICQYVSHNTLLSKLEIIYSKRKKLVVSDLL
jgi:hypothetical protein